MMDRDMKLDPFEDAPPAYPPPPYSELEDGRAHAGPASEHSFDTIQKDMASAKHSHEIWEDGNSLTIHKIGHEDYLFRIAIEVSGFGTHISWLRRTDGRERRIAQARLPRRNEGDFEVYLGNASTPSEDDWIQIQCAKGSGLLKSESYHFNLGHRPLCWKRTHDASLGSSRTASHDYKLMDDSRVGQRAHPHTKAADLAQGFVGPKVIVGGDVIAVYLQHGVHGATGARHMQVDWWDEFGDDVETMALVVLITILERTQKHIRRAGQSS